MKIIEPSVVLMKDFNGDDVMKFLEKCGRTAYKSESNITSDSADRFIRNIIKRSHESVLEHFSCTFKIICDRGISHELVRHRIGTAFTQESTRWCDYSSDKHGNELTFIKPVFWQKDSAFYNTWKATMSWIEELYIGYRKVNIPPEQIRAILPNSLKTEIVMTANLREWRHILKLRTAKDAHPQMRQIAFMVLDIFKNKLPVIFEDIKNDR